jgi:hypothetical protein
VTAAPHAVVEAAREQAGMSHADLWVAYFGLGGVAGPAALRTYLAGRPVPSIEYDLVAQAINERFLDREDISPVPYLDEFD